MAKDRVAPIKPISIPRLELTAAVVAVNVTTMLTNELNYSNLQTVYNTDSEVVLCYINNEARRFHTYVGNRVQHIRDRTEPKQLHPVSGKDNLADQPPVVLLLTKYSTIRNGSQVLLSCGQKRYQW